MLPDYVYQCDVHRIELHNCIDYSLYWERWFRKDYESVASFGTSAYEAAIYRRVMFPCTQ